MQKLCTNVSCQAEAYFACWVLTTRMCDKTPALAPSSASKSFVSLRFDFNCEMVTLMRIFIVLFLCVRTVLNTVCTFTPSFNPHDMLESWVLSARFHGKSKKPQRGEITYPRALEWCFPDLRILLTCSPSNDIISNIPTISKTKTPCFLFWGPFLFYKLPVYLPGLAKFLQILVITHFYAHLQWMKPCKNKIRRLDDW
jgi:hypothetical protein